MTFLGIDLGTTHSLVAMWQKGRATLIRNSLGKLLTPSVVGVDDDGQILVGMAAKERLLTHPDRTVANFKRRMGTTNTITLGGNEFSAVELSSLVLKSLKADAENFLGKEVHEAVISVPAYFNDAQRKATKVAGELAGLKVERLINEPTAAAIAYGLHDRPKETQFLVLDLGGGTFDVSVLELFDDVMEVHSTAGDNFLGGEDFAAEIYRGFLKSQSLDHEKMDELQISGLQKKCELCKIQLTDSKEATIEFSYNDSSYTWTLTRKKFEQLCSSLIDRIRHPIERALRDADVKPSQLDDIILVGGATRMPLVRSLVTKMFRRFPTATLNPDEVVGLGAAIQAGLKGRDAALAEVVLTDVCPYTLGMEIATEQRANQYISGHFFPIIERNSVVPVSKVEQVKTIQANQKEISVAIYQGESRLVKNNIKLGEVNIALQGDQKEEAVEVRFTYDINGILEVEVKIASTGEIRRKIIENSPSTLTQEQIEDSLRKLAELKIHPRDQAENRALLARTERLYEESLGDKRHYIAQILTKYEAILEEQNLKEVERARKELSKILDRLEHESRFE